MLSRREMISVLGAASVASAQPPAAPPLCIFSQHLSNLEYWDLGPVANDLGFDGIDLTVRPGGHVVPEKAPVDLLRAVESIQGEGLEIPMITTAIASVEDPWARFLLGVSGRLGIRYFVPGERRFSPSEPLETRSAHMRKDIAGLAEMGQNYNIVLGVRNRPGDLDGAEPPLLGTANPLWAGYYFDPSQANTEGGVAGWDAALKLALPRLKMVAAKDFFWEKTGGSWGIRPCPAGQGMVNWQKFFAMLAAARFRGPISLQLDYEPANPLTAMVRDLEFVRKHRDAAYSTPAPQATPVGAANSS
jgi:sugar phosphate isomerase/epimerase